jgi:hypothetical protein
MFEQDWSSHFGGMLTTQPCTDTGNASVIGGLARTFYTRVGDVYRTGSTPSSRGALYSFEPRVAEQELRGMLRPWEAKGLVTVALREAALSCSPLSSTSAVSGSRGSRLWAVRSTGRPAIRVHSSAGRVVVATVGIDALIEGDLAKLCNLSVTHGREGVSQYNETMAGRRAEPNLREAAHTQINFPVAYTDLETGVPLPGVGPVDNVAVGDADNLTQSYTYRITLTNNSMKRVPLPLPSQGYDAREWQLFSNYFRAYARTGLKLTLRHMINLFPVPGDKADVCNYGPFSTNPISPDFASMWPTANTSTRDLLLQKHKDYQLGFLHFISVDSSVPAAVREEMKTWGLPSDEFTSSGHWPTSLYVREANRLIGAEVFTQHSREDAVVRMQVSSPAGYNSIGLGSYSFDSNLVQRVPVQGRLRSEGGFVYSPASMSQLFEIPASVMLPTEQESRRVPLLVTMALSASHVGFACLRLTPQFLAIAEAAGTLAAMYLETGVDMHALAKSRAFEDELHKGGSILHAEDIQFNDEALSCYEQESGPHTRTLKSDDSATITREVGEEVLLTIYMYNENGKQLKPPPPPSTAEFSPPAPTLARYAIGSVMLGGNTIRAEMDAGNPGHTLLVAKTCLGCSDKCPAAVPKCAGAQFCAPSYRFDFVPSGSIRATGMRCGSHGQNAGKLDGQHICMACFGGHSHSRFYLLATGNASLVAYSKHNFGNLWKPSKSFVVPKLNFGALVRTAPWTDRIWSNVGLGFRSAFLTQVNASTLLFSLRAPPQLSMIGLRPSLTRYASLSAQKFSSKPGNRYLSATMFYGDITCGPRLDYLFDTGNAGVSIASNEMAMALKNVTGGVWNTSGSGSGNLWINRALNPPQDMVIAIGTISVHLPATVWAPFKTGQTVFERYDKNVLGLPVIMMGDFVFDDARRMMWYSNSSQFTTADSSKSKTTVKTDDFVPSGLDGPVRHDLGFVGTYHSPTGTVQDGHNTSAQAVGNWGVVALANHEYDGSESFAQNIKQNCRQADVNVLLGMVIAQSEGGTFNNSNDTELMRPHNVTGRGASPPPGGPAGMLQAAARFSALSRTVCPQIQGIVIDDFFVNYKACTRVPTPPIPPPAPPGECASCPKSHATQYGSMGAGVYCCSGQVSCGRCHGGICCLWPGSQHHCQGAKRCDTNPTNYTPCHISPPSPPTPSCEAGAQGLNFAHMLDIKAALQGKLLLNGGKVDHASPSLTPHLKLFAVVYPQDIENSLSNCSLFEHGVVDGLSLWVGGNVSESVSRARQEVGQRLPIITGAYIYNSAAHWTIQPKSFYQLLNQSIELYDSGELEGFFSTCLH